MIGQNGKPISTTNRYRIHTTYSEDIANGKEPIDGSKPNSDTKLYLESSIYYQNSVDELDPLNLVFEKTKFTSFSENEMMMVLQLLEQLALCNPDYKGCEFESELIKD